MIRSVLSRSKRSLISKRWLSTKTYGTIEESDLQYFRSVLRPESVLTDPDILDTHNTDWLKKYSGSSPLVLRPKSTSEVSKILSHCNSRKLPVVPQGGNTGLVGGSVPVGNEIILSLSGMNAIESFDKVSGILVCEAGAILENLDSHVASFGYMMPLDLGAKGTCQIGGNVSTNAGGLRLLRYGSLHGSVLGLEVVLPSGSVINCLSTMRKDNTGYDMKQLFIGSEGTLGVVTKVSILTPARPTSTNVALLACPTFKHVLDAFVAAKSSLGEVLSAVEFMDRQSLEMVFSQQDWSRDPLSPSPYYVLLETSGSNASHDLEKLNTYLEDVMTSGVVVDGTVAQDSVQGRDLFLLREDITVALVSRGYVYKYDVSLPLEHYYELVSEIRKRLEEAGISQDVAKVVGFGHLGDCNLHLNVSTVKYDPAVMEVLEPFIFEWTSERGGSISAEHGIGQHKAEYMHLANEPAALDLMTQFKEMMDPNGILNPYKMFPKK